MRTIGIDLAVSGKGTAIAHVDWVAGKAHATFPSRLAQGCSDEDALAMTNDAILSVLADPSVDVVAIDVPLGWPAGFGEAVTRYGRGEGWQFPGDDPAAGYRGFRLRNTDRCVRATAAEDGISLSPLSVSADKLGAPAMRAAWLLTEHLGDIDKSGLTGRVVEAYPTGAARMWDLSFGDYRTAPRSAWRETKERCLEEFSTWAAGMHLADGLADEHEVDAVICALVARAARAPSGLTHVPQSDEDLALAHEEGWIHLPVRHSLPRLFDPSW